VALEFLDAFLGEFDPFLGRNARLEKKFSRGRIDPRAMQVEIGHHAFEFARAVEHHRAEPDRVRARTHEEDVSLMPFAVEKRPRTQGLNFLCQVPIGLRARAPRACAWATPAMKGHAPRIALASTGRCRRRRRPYAPSRRLRCGGPISCRNDPCD